MKYQANSNVRVFDQYSHLTNPTGLEDDLTDPEGPLPTVVVVVH
jgi:hypothetical protein